ncbi:MAG: biotin/lipoyl-containing protein [Caldilineaceae bacterium]
MPSGNLNRCEIATDKIDTEIPAPAATLLAIVATEGETVPVGAVLAHIGAAGEQVDGETMGSGTVDSETVDSGTVDGGPIGSGTVTDGQLVRPSGREFVSPVVKHCAQAQC